MECLGCEIFSEKFKGSKNNPEILRGLKILPSEKSKGCETIKGVQFYFGAEVKGCENLFGKSKGCENMRRKFKRYEKFSPFSEKHSNRVSNLKKDRPLNKLFFQAQSHQRTIHTEWQDPSKPKSGGRRKSVHQCPCDHCGLTFTLQVG